MCNMFHVAITALNIDVYGEWVPSKANVSDIPTRPERMAELVQQGFRWGAGCDTRRPGTIEWAPLALPPHRPGRRGEDENGKVSMPLDEWLEIMIEREKWAPRRSAAWW